MAGSRARAGSSGRRDDVLQLLRAAKTPLSIAAIARHRGVYQNTARFHRVTRLVSLFGELGLDPDLRGPGDRQLIGLRHCPFQALARALAQLVHPVHLGLMQGATARGSRG